ncbi:MAG: ParA family protein [Bacteroidota bacterium]
MRVIAFSNLKGGSSKTTSSLSVAAELARRGHRVLLVDLDPQATLTKSAGLDPSHAAARFLKGEVEASDAVETPDWDGALGDGGGALHLVPASRQLVQFEGQAVARLANRLVGLLDAVEADYDFAVIDSPPQASALVTATLASADEVYVPVASGRGALDGLVDVVELSKRFGTTPVSGAFATRVNVSSHHDLDLAAYVAEQAAGPDGEGGLKTYVRETVRVREAEMARVPLPFYDPSSTAAQDYAALADEIESRPSPRIV